MYQCVLLLDVVAVSIPTKFCHFFRVAELTQEQCREAMIEYAASNCCYGSKPAKEHEIKGITASTALHVRNYELFFTA